MVTLPHQLWLHIFTDRFVVSRSGSDSTMPAKGDDMFNICCRALLEMKWITHICNVMLAFNRAKLTISHGGLIFFFLGYKKKIAALFLCCKKKSQAHVQIRHWDSVSYHVHRDVQVSLCSCKHHVPDMIKTRLGLITWILKSR